MIDLLLAAALLQPASCYAAGAGGGLPGCPDWRSVTRDREGEVYIDPATLERSGDMITVITRIVYARGDENGTRSHVTRARFDCARRTSAILHLATYDARGRRLDDWEVSGEPAEPRPVEPNSPGQTIINALCPRPAPAARKEISCSTF